MRWLELAGFELGSFAEVGGAGVVVSLEEATEVIGVRDSDAAGDFGDGELAFAEQLGGAFHADFR